MNAMVRLPQRGKAYQPRVQPWEWDGGYGCVLKERCIGRARVGDATICGVPSERMNGNPRSPGLHPGLVCPAPLEPRNAPKGQRIPAKGATLGRVKPWIPIPGGGGGMSAQFAVSQRDTAYQPRATPWEPCPTHPRVLKERRISPKGGRVTDQPRCGVPSERIHCGFSDPRVPPWAGMPGSVGAGNSAN